MSSKVISVVIPTYKPAEYLDYCLSSLAAQTLPAEQFEVVIVLNGPTTPYQAQLEEYASRYSNLDIRLLLSEQAGVSVARNLGISSATGQYVSFVDDDDWLSPSYLEQLLALASADSIVASNIIAIDDASGLQQDFYLTAAYQRLAGVGELSVFKARSFLSPVGGKLIPMDVIGSDRFDTRFKLGEDSLFLFDISRKVSCVRLAPSDAVYYYRDRQGSSTRRQFTYWFRLKQAFRVAARYTIIYLKHPFSYNFPFYLSRVVAQMLKLFYRTYH